MLVYTPHITARFNYIIQFLKERWKIDIEVTNNVASFKQHTGIKIQYCYTQISNDGFFLQSIGLLQQNNICKQDIDCFDFDGVKAFYRTNDYFGFDLFSAIFYLITRYEEYLHYEPDEYGRYAHWNSLAWKQGFLHKPIIDIWLMKFNDKLKQVYSELNIEPSSFTFIPTYDIDIAWSYKHKGLLKTIGAALIHPLTIIKRLLVLIGRERDPYDSYAWMQLLHQQYVLQPIYFFLVSKQQNKYDRNILPSKKALQQLVRKIAATTQIGLHPSTQSTVNELLLAEEKETLESFCNREVTSTRNHYIQIHLPRSYNRLIANKFRNDYSMGYGTINGFRASTSQSFLWYNLENETASALRIHPFAYMEANSFYELRHSPEQAKMEMKLLCEEVQKVNGTFITIFHNHILGTDPMFNGWSEMYKRFIDELMQNKS